MSRKKTTIYLEPGLLTAAKALAARSGRHEYEVIEDALRAYLHRDGGTAGGLDLHGMLDRWSAQETGLMKTRRSSSLRAKRMPTVQSSDEQQ
jgi:hypothetical protein